jgi:hypothetical protein
MRRGQSGSKNKIKIRIKTKSRTRAGGRVVSAPELR